jgi:hypothetical protein
MEVHEALEQVWDRESFVVFVETLKDDWYDSESQERANPSSPWGPAANGRENMTIGAFLEAALRWAVDSDTGEVRRLPEEPSWQAFADFLYCGKIYE